MTSRDPQFADGKAERLQSVVTTSEESQSSNGQLPTGWIGMRMKPVARGEASNSGSSRDGGYRSSASEEAVEVSRSMDSASDDALYEVRSEDELLPTKGEPFESRNGVVQRTRSLNEGGEARDASPMMYKLYKRRWFGLIQLTLLNIIVSWNVCLTFCLCPPPYADIDFHSGYPSLQCRPHLPNTSTSQWVQSTG